MGRPRPPLGPAASTRGLRWGVLAPVVVLVAGCAAPAALPEGALDDVRAAVERFRDPSVAEAEGFIRDPTDVCEVPANLGGDDTEAAMGIHYLHPERLGLPPGGTRLDVTATHTDFLEPAVLVYEPMEDGTLELVAVENLVSARAWARAGHDTAPRFHGVEWPLTPDDPARVIEAHYDLHLWLFRDNPRGATAPYNPAVTCRHHQRYMPMNHPMGDADHRDQHEHR